jgi:hypothetical protein
MTSKMNSRYGFIVVITLIAMAAVAGTMGTTNSQSSAMQAAVIDVWAIHANVHGANLPDLTVAEAF